MQYMGKYVPLGCTGLKVSRIAFGCGFRGIYDENEAASTIRMAIDCGVNFIDCANIYKLRSGIHAETALGKAVQGLRDKVIITSKFGAQIDERHPTLNGSGASRYHMVRAVEDSLRRFSTDYIDVYLLHMPDSETAYEETMRAFEQLCRDGKIRYAGLCNHNAWQITAMQEIHKRYGGCPISVIQNPYNLLNRSAEEELFPAAAYGRLGVMAYSPLGAGLLGGAFADGRPAPEKSTWGYDPVYREYMKRVFPGRIAHIVDAVAGMARRYGVSSAVIATAWVLQNSQVTCAISGADTMAEFADSLKAASLELRSEDRAELDRLSYGMREVFSHPEVQKKAAVYQEMKSEE
ncbi:MAG: aldo/keto reductase [Anaerotruncus rubiinfantis]|jgi:aryl-alcohol dehydrogenase-like predicted oxidoreductase|uniref:aldo/keto reductase n=1 Tax=Anaerotruncus rubiinfantis TaxID=1720200 RepID=UPI00189BA986|nr:aldo/keto reductase [Anaerotruncus rubiinfantis]